MEKEKQQPPPDEHRCTQSDGKGWRCKNFRMGLGASADDARILASHCEKHYNYNKNRRKKKRNGDHGEEKKKKVPEKEEEDVDSSDIQGGSANIQTKRKEVERSVELDFTDFLIEKKEMEKKELPPDEQRCRQKDGKRWRCKNFRMGLGADAAEDENGVPKSRLCEKHYNYYADKKLLPLDEQHCCQSNGLGWRCNNFRMGHGAADDDTVPKSKFCEKHYNYYAEKKLFKKNSSGNGDTTAAGGSAKTGPKRKHIERTEGSGEIKLLTKTVVETRTSKRWKNVKEGVQFVADTSNQPATIVTQSVEKQSDETCCGGREYSPVYELQSKEELLNMYGNLEEGNVLVCSEERPSQLGSSSGDHLEMNKKPFVNLVSDDDSGENIGESGDSDCSDDTETSLGTLMDMLAMKYRNRNENQDIEWKFEADMLSSFEDDPELNLKAVCALYRQHIAEVEISTKGLFHGSDMLRATTLAKFLVDGDSKGDIKKCVTELEKFDSEGVEDCKRLARSYSKQLFNIYQNRRDPFFLPDATARHGDQTAK